MKPALRNAGDASEHVSEPGQRIDVVELGRHDQRGHDRRPVGPAFGTGKEPRLTSQRKAAQRALGRVVGEADPAVVDESSSFNSICSSSRALRSELLP